MSLNQYFKNFKKFLLLGIILVEILVFSHFGSRPSYAQTPTIAQNYYRFYENNDGIQPITPLANENTALNDIGSGTVLRLRISLSVTEASASAGQSFKLQFATSTAGPWSDVGSIGSPAIWRGFNNSTPSDGATLTSTLLSVSNVVETYEEENNSAGTPNTINAGQDGEWDWVIQNNSALGRVTYFFRMVKDDGSALDSYVNYPQVTPRTELSFSMEGVLANVNIEGITTDVTTTSTTIPFGNLSVNFPKEAAHLLTISTNAASGYTVLMKQNQDLTAEAGVTIDGVSGTNSSPGSWPGSVLGGAFGYHSADHSLGTGTTSRFSNDNTYARFETTAFEIVYSSGPVSGEQVYFVYKIEIGGAQAPGSYINSLFFIATPVF
ncbi:hypothetical protein KKB64_01215 [Patescibacteria group bacterium]|nr:hypothetical protein [Patescibacteria group bacterium]